MNQKGAELSLLFKIPIWIYHTIVLSVLWFVCSLPVFTLPAASAAAYELTYDIYEEHDMRILTDFFRFFVKRLRRSVAIALAYIIFGILAGLSLYSSLHILPFGVLSSACTAVGIVFILVACILTITVPVCFSRKASVREIWQGSMQLISTKYVQLLLLLVLLALCVFLCLEFYATMLAVPTLYTCVVRYLLE